MAYPSNGNDQSSASDTTSLPAKDQSSAIRSKDGTLSGDTLPVMTGTDKTTVEPGIPTIQPSFSLLSGTWSDSFMPTKDKTSTSAPLTSPTPAKDQSSYSVPAKAQSSTSAAAKDQSSSTIPAKDQIPTSVPAKDQTSSSLPGMDQSPYSISAKDQTLSSVPSKDQTTISSVLTKDLTSSPSNQVYSISIPTSGKDDKTSFKPETSMSSSEPYKSENGPTSSTLPSIVIYSFTLPSSSVPDSGISSKPETTPSVVVSSFTVPSVIYSFTLPSSTPGTSTSIPIPGPSPTETETSGPTSKLEQPPGGKDSTSTVNGPFINTTSSVVPLWTPDMLGNAYGGGFINIPSIYVTLTSNPTATATTVPPGYGITFKPKTSQSIDKPYSIISVSASSSNDETGYSGSSTTQTIALSGSGSSYTTDQYGIPTSGTSSKTGSTDCCGTSTTLSVGQIDNFGTPVSVPVGGSSTPESSTYSYTFGKMFPTPIATAPYGGNTSLPNANGSNRSTEGLLNSTALPDYRGFGIKNSMGFTAGLLGILVFVFLI